MPFPFLPESYNNYIKIFINLNISKNKTLKRKKYYYSIYKKNIYQIFIKHIHLLLKSNLGNKILKKYMSSRIDLS